MHITSSINTQFGPRGLEPAAMIPVRLTPDEVRGLARMLMLDAELAEAAGQFERADRLATRAAALREAVR